jgi:sterol desaturase/sphingolipid hydroxylase (fatty acid hydroxylase superfamily)
VIGVPTITPAIVLGILGMVAIVTIRYLVVSGGFAWATARRGITAGPANPEKRRRQIASEIRWSLLSAVIYAVPAGLALELWRNYGLTKLQTSLSTPAEWLWFPASIAVYLFLHDTWFYWTHRWMHGPKLFKTVHAVHHASKPPTAWAAMSFHPWEALSGAILLPALAFLIPIHVAAMAIVLTIATIMGVTNHMGWEMFPKSWVNGWFGRHFISASHHEAHHRHYNCNYGLYFRFWDRLAKTDRGIVPDFN